MRKCNSQTSLVSRKISLSDSEPSPVLSQTETPKSVRRRFWWISFICLGPILLGSLFWGLRETAIFRYSMQSAHWPRVSGKIVESSVTPYGETQWQAQVRYQYKVDDILYESTRPRFVNIRFKNRDAAEYVSQTYGANKEVPVFYHPSNPEISVLRPGTEWELLPTIIICFSISGGTLVGIFLLVRRMETQYHEKQLRAKNSGSAS